MKVFGVNLIFYKDEWKYFFYFYFGDNHYINKKASKINKKKFVGKEKSCIFATSKDENELFEKMNYILPM